MKIRFIINPNAGKKDHHNIDEYIKKYISNYEIFYTKKAGDIKRISQNAVEKNINAVVIVGGDGSVNESLSSLTNTNTALGIIPSGSGNGFAYHIGMNKNIKKAIKQIKLCDIQEIDTCLINNISFINIAGIGFDAHIANLFLKEQKRGLLKYIKLIIQQLNYKAKKYTLVNNNTEKKIEAFLISFANASQYGNNAKICPQANIEDGFLDIVIIHKFPKWKIPILITKLFLGKINTFKYVENIKLKNIKIYTNETLIHTDGEPNNISNPINVINKKKSIKILIPKKKKK